MKLVIRVDPETGDVYGAIVRRGEKLPPLIKPKKKKKKEEENERKN